jgi:hypothetical protein
MQRRVDAVDSGQEKKLMVGNRTTARVEAAEDLAERPARIGR